MCVGGICCPFCGQGVGFIGQIWIAITGFVSVTAMTIWIAIKGVPAKLKEKLKFK